MAGTSNAVNGPEAAPYLAKSGGTMSGVINMGSNLVSNLPAPSAGGDATNKTYVDNLVQNVHVACLAGSTANLTATYANGASGVGATLTNSGAFAVFSIDGVSPSVGQRVLIKNQAAQLENGVYTVTTVGDAVSVNWVLTRATDYDEASEMQAGDKFAVVSGTTQAATEWMMTQTAAITVGVTSITFAEMGQVTGSFTSVVEQVFTATGAGTYTPTSGMIYCIVEGVGGGASGGSCSAAAGAGSAGGGGGAGGYFRKIFTAAELGANAPLNVGAGGAAAAAGANPGNAGGTTDFNPAGTGATLTGNGGTGGGAGTSGAGIQASASAGYGGGTATNGDVNISGGSGADSFSLGGGTLSVSGGGGSSYFGFGSPGITSVTNAGGSGGIAKGSGGSGAAAISADRAGGAGADGMIIVTEFVSTSA